ncbi:kinase-like domain-containing protein [Glomus cerebriforme]|uniref:Kinase-like domain-containing protein n=1 Tax=Glomus cerebriforme TaxID=658196 RepID=A0A397TND3_9GLOM|nr:kinase-like domain-containing protein [Glomus cerebriforme]
MEQSSYEILTNYGEGTFGVVYKARQKPSGDLVAIKKSIEVRYERPARERLENERRVLNKVKHENVISLIPCDETLNSLSPTLSRFNVQLNINSLIFPFCPLTLRTLLDEYILTLSKIKSCMWMTLNGVAYIHECEVIHRDLSPKNILINDLGVIKIADFDDAWLESYNGDEKRGKMRFEIGTRIYRAPELLFSSGDYSYAIDLWSLGCIFAEFFTKDVGYPLFDGGSDIEQLCKIFQILGVANESNWPEVAAYPDYGKFKFAESDSAGLTVNHLPHANQEIVDFIAKFLKYPTKERITAREALQDSLFQSDDFSKTHIDISFLRKK